MSRISSYANFKIDMYLETLPDEESRLSVQFVELGVARGTGSAEEGLHLDHPLVELQGTDDVILPRNQMRWN